MRAPNKERRTSVRSWVLFVLKKCSQNFSTFFGYAVFLISVRFIWYSFIEIALFLNASTFFIAGKRPASLVLPTAPRRPTRGGHQGSWATMPGSTRARRQQQNRQVRYDLHLPSMPTLTCKTSSQALLLRVLKVILQLREAALKSTSGTTSSRTRISQRRGELELDYS